MHEYSFFFDKRLNFKTVIYQITFYLIYKYDPISATTLGRSRPGSDGAKRGILHPPKL